ncbi:MAG TPA: glycosyltransferase [Polyangiaceae bacterium]|nr:glycosyltransferase [Polyangiaceae bacterium]
MTTPGKAPQFLFDHYGSRGDVIPLLSIAGELVRRGHSCHLLANEHFRAEALERGVGFSASTQLHTNPVGPCSYKVDEYMFRTFDGVRGYFERANASGVDTVVVNTEDWAASEPFAEARCLRTVRLHIVPLRIRSLLSPAWPLCAFAAGPQGEEFLRVKLPALYRAYDANPKVLGRINAVRARVGLPPVRDASYRRPHLVAQAALFPDWFGTPAPDWPPMECLGFPLPQAQAALPARLLEFLERVRPPLVFTPGTSVGETEAFFEAAASCCAQLGLPGIFLSPFLRRRDFGPSIAHFEHIELQCLLRHAALLVHHGGIGTAARALEAGIPQVISPVRFDQPDNARRVQLLGVGGVVQRAELTGATLAAAIRPLLGDPALQARLAHYRTALAGAKAIERSAELLEHVARCCPRPGSTSTETRAAAE